MIPDRYLTNPIHRELVDELLSLSTAEERLEWLMERSPMHRPVDPSERTESYKVPGCLSGLWLKGEVRDSRCHFAAHSDSDLVNGVVSYICDLYSERSPAEVLELGDLLTRTLRLDGLLSTTRQRAVSSSLAFFHHIASQHATTA
jgi:cysteine desulfuration protein SufE